MPGELMVVGSPLLRLPLLRLSHLRRPVCPRGPDPEAPAPGRIRVVLTGALLTMLLDVITDPIATMGDRWFLGKIHFYAHPAGSTSACPSPTSRGWFLVAFCIIGFNVLCWRLLPGIFNHRTIGPSDHRTTWLYPAFLQQHRPLQHRDHLLGREWRLALCSSGILLGITLAATRSRFLFDK